MRKIVIIFLYCGLALLLLVGCSPSSVELDYKPEDKTLVSMFIEVEDTVGWRVVYHRKTKVMYVVSDGGYNMGTFTLLVDADGEPMLWEEDID